MGASIHMNGLIFPGQGSQSIGMGRELYESNLVAKRLLDKANIIMDYDLKDLMFNGPEEKLTDTLFAQPAIYTCSAMYMEIVRNLSIDYSYVAGHSLGEYSALYAAGVFDFETGFNLVKARAESMSQMNGKGIMAAIMGLNEEELAPYMVDDAVMANLNSRTQIVISGTKSAVEEVCEKVESLDGVKVRRLSVSAAFHSPQMQETEEIMRKLIEATEFRKPSCKVISNVTGRTTEDAQEIKDNLIAQITGQVRWFDTIMEMKTCGVDFLYEVGNGEVLRKMTKAITLRPRCKAVEVRVNGI